MTGILVDSDILIEVFRGRDRILLQAWHDLSQREVLVATSAINVAELWRGVLAPERDALRQLLAELTCLPLDREEGELAGELMRRYAPSHGLELPDALIASVAVTQRLDFWTRNRRHFPMPELRFYEV